MWHEYFPNADIWGIDTRTYVNVNLDDLRLTPRMHLLFDDAYVPEMIAYFKGNAIRFDFMLDDGPHTMDSWKWFLEYYRKLLNKNGIMVIEDIFSIEQAEELIQTFTGDRDRLSIIDRRATPGAYKEHFDNEILLVYM